MKHLASTLICLLLAHPVGHAKPPAPRIAKGHSIAVIQWNRLVDEYYDVYLRFHPTTATWFGIHRFDEYLEDFSREATSIYVTRLKELMTRLEGISPQALSPSDRHDREAVIHAIKAELLELEQVKGWEKNPDLYSSSLSQSVWLLMSRRFAPPEVRLKSVIERERRMPALLQTARVNLRTPPKVFTGIAIQQLPDIIAFFQKDVPAAFSEVKDATLQQEFREANEAVVSALKSYLTYLQDELLPASTGEFALGAETYRKKLLFEEMVDIPLDRLLALGYEDLRRNQAELKRIAAMIDPKATVQDVMDRAMKDHSSSDGLLQAFRDQLLGAKTFVKKRRLLTLPSQSLPSVIETPPFMRATSMASMDTPGPYEKSTEAFINVTLPAPDWSPEKAQSYLEGYNRGIVYSFAVHEAMPGHYIQFLYVNQVASKVRKLTQCGTNVEGWAHYVEQMMLDEGYGNDDPWLRIGELQNALLRNARYIVGISMHTGGMTQEQAQEFFVKEGYQSKVFAEIEARRGTSDPLYLVYTLGKLQILKLREDYRKKMGSRYSLKAFHDAFLSRGGLPIRIVREEMLGDAGKVL